MLEENMRTLRRAYTEAREETDPFEKFNRAQGMGAIVDPYAGLAAMRAAGPVHRIELKGLMGDLKLPMALKTDALYVAVGFDAVAEVLRVGARFSPAAYAGRLRLA